MKLMLDRKRAPTPFDPDRVYVSSMPRRKYGRMVHDIGSNAGKNSAPRNRGPGGPKA